MQSASIRFIFIFGSRWPSSFFPPSFTRLDANQTAAAFARRSDVRQDAHFTPRHISGSHDDSSQGGPEVTVMKSVCVSVCEAVSVCVWGGKTYFLSVSGVDT